MNLRKFKITPLLFIYSLLQKVKLLLPQQKSTIIGNTSNSGRASIGKIYFINLDRQPKRLYSLYRELRHINDNLGADLTTLTERFPAIDANDFENFSPTSAVDPFYTLKDQLFVEPQPNTLPEKFELDRPIRMSRPEIAVALSHIEIWKKIASGNELFCLVLEDDVTFSSNFGRILDQVWGEIKTNEYSQPTFDILYLSYQEAKHGAPKSLISKNVFKPSRGLWHLSGYVLSRHGAIKLLDLLPCRGPVDLWLNLQFNKLEVCASRKSIINQRLDRGSNNSYSVLPALTKLGVIDSESAALFNCPTLISPVFAFGPPNSGLSSLAMALSMLGYKCCSDLSELPKLEHNKLIQGSKDRIFNAYVNIGSLLPLISDLHELFPSAKFIFSSEFENFGHKIYLEFKKDNLPDHIILSKRELNKWKIVCEYLRCTPPFIPYPNICDIGQRELISKSTIITQTTGVVNLKWDNSPWVIKNVIDWAGINCHISNLSSMIDKKVEFKDNFSSINTERWFFREDTFAGNLALFRPENILNNFSDGLEFKIKDEDCGIRKFTAAAITSKKLYFYGRFDAYIKPSDVPGVVTGFFLHRDSPRQEIDVEFVGGRTSQLLVNVFYNPGDDGASFDYGYRGSPTSIKLNFDASKDFHKYSVDWSPNTITWLVDDQPIYRRYNWNPTPIPHLPMLLHFNTWPSRSREFAGRFKKKKLPSFSYLRSLNITNSTPIKD